MDEYIKRKDAEEYIKNFGKGAISDGLKTLDPVDDIVLLARGLDMIPAADVVEVVRCKECKYGEADYGCGGDIVIPFQYRCTYEGHSWNAPDHFCSYGIRKEGAEE